MPNNLLSAYNSLRHCISHYGDGVVHPLCIRCEAPRRVDTHQPLQRACWGIAQSVEEKAIRSAPLPNDRAPCSHCQLLHIIASMHTTAGRDSLAEVQASIVDGESCHHGNPRCWWEWRTRQQRHQEEAEEDEQAQVSEEEERAALPAPKTWKELAQPALSSLCYLSSVSCHSKCCWFAVPCVVIVQSFGTLIANTISWISFPSTSLIYSTYGE